MTGLVDMAVMGNTRVSTIFFRETAIGRIGIAESGGVVTNLCFGSDAIPEVALSGTTPLLDEAFLQLDDWLAGEIELFSLPLAPAGTGFMQRVWRQLQDIPYGCTTTYREIATAVGTPGAARAVGTACGRNPLPIFIPCHRVIGSDGGLGGYRGGTDLKRRLLELEQRWNRT
jgi:methylated-DNA-[protein]-cysteine S-methyltransferase